MSLLHDNDGNGDGFLVIVSYIQICPAYTSLQDPVN